VRSILTRPLENQELSASGRRLALRKDVEAFSFQAGCRPAAVPEEPLPWSEALTAAGRTALAWQLLRWEQLSAESGDHFDHPRPPLDWPWPTVFRAVDDARRSSGGPLLSLTV